MCAVSVHCATRRGTSECKDNNFNVKRKCVQIFFKNVIIWWTGRVPRECEARGCKVRQTCRRRDCITSICVWEKSDRLVGREAEWLVRGGKKLFCDLGNNTVQTRFVDNYCAAELEGRIIITLYVEEFGRIEFNIYILHTVYAASMRVAGFRGIGTTTLYLFRSVASWVVEKDYRARERGTFWILFSRTCMRLCTGIYCTASKALLLLLLLYGKPIIKQISKTPRWKRKKDIRRRLGGYRGMLWLYIKNSTEEEEIKKREITITPK